MNRKHPNLSTEPDVSHEIDTVLRAMIVLLAILMTTILTGAAIKSFLLSIG